MALFSQAALLDELFGADRNSTVKTEITWDDDTICKYYLAGFCPHDLFVNTKMSLGQCPKVHDVKLLDKYRNSKQLLRMSYEKRLNQFLQRYVDDVKKKIVYNVERLENGLLSGTEVGIQKRITTLENEVNELVKKIEDCGNEGRIEECRHLNNELEEKQKTLKYDRIELETQRRNTRERLEEVCNTCGAYISKNDPRNSLENHVSGRIHCSYVKINEILESLNATLKKAERMSEERRNSPERDRRSTSRHKHRDHDRRHERISEEGRHSLAKEHRSESRHKTRKHESGNRSRDRDRSNEEQHRKSHKKEKKHSRSRSRSHRNDNDTRKIKSEKKENKTNDNKGNSWGEI